jgi:hypothetical protein
MSAKLPNLSTRSKPAPSAEHRTKPPKQNPQKHGRGAEVAAATRTLREVATRCPMSTDARMLANAAADLLGMVENFTDTHTGSSILRAIGEAGLTAGNRDYFIDMASSLLHDAEGLRYNLEAFVSFFTSELLSAEDEGSEVGVRRAR